MSVHVLVRNESRDQILATDAELAASTWTRFWGLMGRKELPVGGGLVLRPGGPIHMFFMRMSLDVLHLDGNGRATHVLRGIKPWRLGPLFVGGACTIELPEGAARDTAPGDRISVTEAS